MSSSSDDVQPPSDNLDLGTAGASSAREHARRKTAREARLRKKWGRLGGAVVRLSEAPQHETAWSRGERGESKVAASLEKLLAGSGVVVMHDRRIPGTRANIDHVAVGPGGVTVIDAKNYKGKVRTERRGGLLRPRTEHLLVGGRDKTKLVEGVERQRDLVVTALAEAGVVAEVRAALCFADVDGLPLLGQLKVRDIVVDGPKAIARIARRDGDIDPGGVDRLVGALAAAFPVA